ncbi:MAG: C40 family peptidase, partial [Chitinophagaceae bacterium]|nr:C40 family peptidase [Chitinophagaceae bacterium]
MNIYTTKFQKIFVYSKPSHKSELITQLLSNEFVFVLEENGSWSYIQFKKNKDKGWVLSSLITKVKNNQERVYDIQEFNKTNLIAILNQYKNVPYLWGGATNLGIDCSGLSMNLYQHFGIFLPHFASKQIKLGNTILSIENAKCGDLLFFKNDKNVIYHVSIFISKNKIVHS